MSDWGSAARIKKGRDPSTGTFARIGMAVLLVSYGVNAMDRTLFPMMLTDVRREYAFTLPQAGLMSTVFTIGMALAGVLTGYLMSRYSRKAVVQTGIFIFSAATIVTVVSAGMRCDGVPAFVVFHDRALAEMAARRPADLDQLASVPGVGPRKLALYGDQLLGILGV